MKFDFGNEENIVGKRENAAYQHFLLFSPCFQKGFFPRSWLCSKELSIYTISFSRIANIDSLSDDKILFLSKLKAFEDDKFSQTVLWKKGYLHNYGFMLLTLSQTTNFRHFHTERFCRRQFEFWLKWRKVLKKGRKHCGKRRNCSLQAISPFPTVFSKDLYCRHVKTRACLGKGKFF